MNQELQRALFTLLEILAAAFAFATALAIEADMDLAVVLGLAFAAFLCFIAGIGLAARGVLVLAPRDAVNFILALVAVTVSLIAGAYVGGLIAPSSQGDEAARFATRVTDLFEQLSEARNLDLQRLEDAPGAARQAAIANRLSEAFARRARSLHHLPPPPRGRQAVRALAGCLASVADAYREVASMVNDPGGSQVKLNRALRKASQAERSLTRCTMRLANHGYSVTYSLHSVT
jgi:hypothetical protein